MTSKEALIELICEAKSLNRNDKRLSFLRKTIEEELKILEIIKTKNIDIFFLRNSCDRVEEYNEEINNNTMHYCYGNCREITQEEFTLLKKVLENE